MLPLVLLRTTSVEIIVCSLRAVKKSFGADLSLPRRDVEVVAEAEAVDVAGLAPQLLPPLLPELPLAAPMVGLLLKLLLPPPLLL
jgi:hypothetical protein